MEDQADELREIMNNSRLSQNFLNLARELDIMEPKVPEDVYKTHLESTGWLFNYFQLTPK